MTEQQYQAWLADLTVERILLAELEHAEGVEYVATAPYISRPTDSVPNRPYDDILNQAVDISTRIDGLISFGDVSLLDDGRLESWLGRAWTGHPIRLYLGGPEWSLDDFRLLARGRNGGVTEARRGSLTFAMEDESRILDEVIDTGELPDDAGPVPLVLGSVYNAPMPRVETTSVTYRASYLALTGVTPKDNGNPVSYTADLAAGRVTLDATPVGEVTADLEEAHNTPPLIAQWVAGQYGIAVAEIGLPAYRVGLYYSGEVTGRQVLDDLCAGLGAYWYLNALGELVVRQHQAPTGPADLTLVSDEIVYDQLTLAETQAPWKSLRLRWGQNHSPLNQLAGTVAANQPEEAARLKRDWNDSHATQAVGDYPLAESAERDSCIQDAADAATERDRLLAIRSVRRDVWEIEAFLPPVSVGDVIAIEHPRLAGRLGREIGVTRSPTRGVSTLEVWV